MEERCKNCYWWTQNPVHRVIGECGLESETKTAEHFCSDFRAKEESEEGKSLIGSEAQG